MKVVKVRKNPVKVERDIKRKVEILPYMQVSITQAAVSEPHEEDTYEEKEAKEVTDMEGEESTERRRRGKDNDASQKRGKRLACLRQSFLTAPSLCNVQ